MQRIITETKILAVPLLGVMLLGLVLTGCSRRNSDGTILPDKDFLEVEKRLDKVPVGKPMLVDEMGETDVLVSVNGYPLTKRFFDAVMATAAKGMMEGRKVSAYEASKRIEEMRPRYVRQFVTRRLLIDDAVKNNVLPKEELRKKMVQYIEGVAKASGKTPEQLAKAFDSNSDLVFYDVAEHLVIDALMAAKIPPLVEVDAEFVSNVQAQVTIDNLAAKGTNEAIRATLAQWKADIAAGKLKFDKIVPDRTNELRKVTSTVIGFEELGTFEKSEMTDQKMAKVVFSLENGGVSDPIEDDDGLMLLNVSSITPAVKNDKGRTLKHEKRTVLRLYVDKEPEIIRQTDEEMFKDLKQQMQMRAIYMYAENLQTNGLNSVVYPHGERLFQ